MTYLDRAIKDGYAIITGPENKQKIIYVTSDNHTENYNDPEEKVRAEFWAELIYEYDYPAHRIKVEVTIPDRVPTDRADIVIFSDDEYFCMVYISTMLLEMGVPVANTTPLPPVSSSRYRHFIYRSLDFMASVWLMPPTFRIFVNAARFL